MATARVFKSGNSQAVDAYVTPARISWRNIRRRPCLSADVRDKTPRVRP